MLRVVPKGWLSRGFEILEDDRLVTTVRFVRSTGAAEFTLGDATYAIRQEHPGYASWVLEIGGIAPARARSVRTLFRDSRVIEYAGRRYQLTSRSAFRRNLTVQEGVQFVGYIESERVFSKTLNACLPESLPLAVKVFIVALAVNPWADQDEIM